MKFDERFLDEIKSRLRLSDVIGRTVNLRRQGREYVGLSPFNKEKSPSFFVNDEKGFFHDFSSGKHGDLITFLQETERLSFPEAVERLAAEAGLPMPAPDPRAAEQEKQRQSLGDWLEQAARWFEAQLRRPGAEAARSYLHKRGLPEDQWARFRIGYSPGGRTGLKDYLVSKGALPKELLEAGLLIEPEGGGQPYDRFRERIIFPIADLRGRVVSFGGRALDPEARAKYLNGPETSVFHKGGMLYGMGEARRLLHLGGEDARLVVVEGYMDVIACQRADIAAVAPMGTALTEDQMAALWRLHPEPTLSFDADAAGQRAAGRAIERALPLLKPGRSFNFAVISGGKDPDDVLREQGPGALKAQLAATEPFVDRLFRIEHEAAQPLDTPERRTALKVRLRKLAAAIADPDLSQAYREALLQKYEGLWPLEKPAFTRADAARAMSRGRDGRRKPALTGAMPVTRAYARKLTQGPHPMAAAIAQAVIADPILLEDRIELLDSQGFCDPELDPLANALVGLFLQGGALDSTALESHLRALGHGELLREITEAARKAHAPFLDAAAAPETRAASWSEAYGQLVKIAALERALQAAKADLENRFDVASFWQLKSERDALQRALKAGEGFGGEGPPH
jgi:DNA primase